MKDKHVRGINAKVAMPQCICGIQERPESLKIKASSFLCDLSAFAIFAFTTRNQKKAASVGWVLPTLILTLLVTLPTAQAAPGGRSSPVKIAEVTQVLMAPETWVAGTVISRHEARLSAEVTGKLVMVKEVGTQLKEDAVVARIDTTFVKLTIEEFEAQVEADRAKLTFLKSEVQRNKRLARQNNAAQIRLDEVRADREVARNELRISQVRLRLARERLRRHVIRTPFAGVVAERLLRRGERADAGDDVVRVIDNDALEVQARVPLDTLDYVRKGDSLSLTINEQQVTAPVRALVATGDGRSRLLDLRIRLNDGVWTVGQSVRVALPSAIAQSVLAVPRDSLVLRRDGAFVFRISDDFKAERIAVTLGVASGMLIAVTGGLKEGDRVVVRGGERLRPGGLVKILDENP